MKHLRIRRIFAEDGRSLIVALDRPRALYTSALSDPSKLTAQFSNAGVDAVIVPLGSLRLVATSIGSMGVILSVRESMNDLDALVATALRLGVDALKFEAFPGGPAETATMAMLESLGRACDAAGMPLLAEMVPHSFEAVENHTVKKVADAARMAMECGADIVKLPIPIDGDLVTVVGYAGVPVVVLGGPGTTPNAFLTTVRTAMQAGAAGLAVGRNIFDAPDPRGAAAALSAIIHAGNRPTTTQ